MGYFTDHSHMCVHVTVVYCSINVMVISKTRKDN